MICVQYSRPTNIRTCCWEALQIGKEEQGLVFRCETLSVTGNESRYDQDRGRSVGSRTVSQEIKWV